MDGDRRQLRDTLKRALRTPIPREFTLELLLVGLILVGFLTQVFTGILLTLYYQASPVTVADSVQFIMRDVSWGWLVRGLHHWSSSALIVLCALHLLHSLLLGRYRFGNAASWYVGWIVLALVTLLAFTGDLLLWDNQAYWRVERLLAEIESLPGFGPSLATMLRGGSQVCATTLSRTYSLHTLFVPWLVWMLLLTSSALFIARIRRRIGGVA
jgi:quinol-cytochrome oxidoreductase complex cytochrome b subunit